MGGRMTKDFDTRDEFAADDDAFWQAHEILKQDLVAPLDSRTVENAAMILARLTINSGDRVKLGLLLARFTDYHHAGRCAPLLLTQAVLQAFERFQRGMSMDEAFWLKHARRGRSKGIIDRQRGRINASVVAAHLNQAESLETAIEAASTERNRSESTMKRDYLHYRRVTKSE